MIDSSKNIMHYIENNIAYIKLNNPKKLNAINLDMWKNISYILKDIDNNNKVRCLVLRGEGNKAFCRS